MLNPTGSDEERTALRCALSTRPMALWPDLVRVLIVAINAGSCAWTAALLGSAQ
jgi:hypothetical protein